MSEEDTETPGWWSEPNDSEPHDPQLRSTGNTYRKITVKNEEEDQVHEDKGKRVKVEQDLGDPESPVSSSEDENILDGYDPTVCRKGLALMIIKDELPFGFVERPAFINLVAVMQPEFKIPSRFSVAKDCFKIYNDEKVKLRQFFRTSGVHVCISIDKWTSLQELDYMRITARYIDDDWKLQNKILKFCPFDILDGEDMAEQIDGYLKEWGIAKVFAVTVDNASSYETFFNYLKERLTSRECDVVKGKYLRMMCMTQVVKQIVGDGLGVADKSISRIREAVRYVRELPERLENFREFRQEENLESKCLLYLDEPTKWNTTYLMLSVALKFRKEFEFYDAWYKLEVPDGAPTATDWDIAKRITDILLVFYELTLRISNPFCVTSHISFDEIISAGEELKEWTNGSNEDVKAVGDKMQLKYDMHWGNLEEKYKLIFMAVVVDPRYKFEFIEYTLRHEYGDEKGSKMTGDLRQAFSELYEAYKHQSGQVKSEYSDPTQSIRKKPKYIMAEKFKNYMLQREDVVKKNDLEVYLEEAILDTEREDFDLLKWWQVNKSRFPVVSRLARDLLSMPISTVASDYAFSFGEKELNSYRSSLTPKIIEALVCAKSWVSTPKEEKSVEEDCQSLLDDDEMAFYPRGVPFGFGMAAAMGGFGMGLGGMNVDGDANAMDLED